MTSVVRDQVKPTCTKCKIKTRTFYYRVGKVYKAECWLCPNCHKFYGIPPGKRIESYHMQIQNFLTSHNNKYQVILADPPWDEPSAKEHYDTMSLEDIANLPVSDIAEKNAVLFMWVINRVADNAKNIIEKWGFEKDVHEIVWHKRRDDVDQIGFGSIVRNTHERLLIGVRGEGLKQHVRDVPSVITAPKRKHSVKPDASFRIIERLYPLQSKIELFSRRRRRGWVTVGNDLPESGPAYEVFLEVDYEEDGGKITYPYPVFEE